MTLDVGLPDTVALGSPADVRGWRRYPEYKDSGVPWLGDVPAHWTVRRLKHLARLESGHTPSRAVPEYWEHCTIPWVSLADVGQIRHGGVDVIHQTAEKVSELGLASSSARLLPAGTVILSRTASVGYAAILGQPMATTQDFANWICGPDLRAEYLLHAFRAMTPEFRRLTMGSTHQTIYMPEIAQFVVAHPPLEEQAEIVRFINRETAKIDALVEKKARLLGLIDEKRAALISRAVTRGLDPTAPMKDSGIEWLGQVPEHWEIKRLKLLAQVRTGVTKGRDLGDAITVEMPYLRVANVQDGFLDLSDVATLAVRHDEAERFSLRHGDILMNEGGDNDKLGRGCVWEAQIDPCLHQNHVFAVRPRRSENPYWISALTSAEYAKIYFMLRAKQTTNLASISGTNIKEFPCLLPPPGEQQAILVYLERETAKLDQVAAKLRRHVELLGEHRTALISAAVTGKIDVREA